MFEDGSVSLLAGQRESFTDPQPSRTNKRADEGRDGGGGGGAHLLLSHSGAPGGGGTPQLAEPTPHT